MQHVTGFNKYFFLLKGFNKEILNLPLSFLSFMVRQMKYEKFTSHSNRVFINTIYTPFPSPSYATALKCFNRLSKGRISPFSAYISVTDRCHLNCWHCSNANAEKAKDLSLTDLMKIIRELQDFGVSCIGLTGGEPSLRDDLEKLVNTVDNRSFSILFTSGYLINADRTRALKEAGLTAIVISLDSHNKDEHNKKRQSEKAFDDAISAIENSLKAGIYTAISCVISKEMLHSKKIYEFINYVGELGVHEIRILEPKPCGKLLNSTFEDFTEHDKAKIRELQYEINRKKDLPKIMALAHINSVNNYGCNAGRTHIYINAHGEVCPCDFSPLSFGSILNEPFELIYKKMIKHFPKPSNGCIISSIYKNIIADDIDINALLIRDENKIERLLSNIGKRPVPKLFAALGFKEG
jgi:MoaA/NifB/PqqE/SkfB family radical SAM enzyme